MNVLIRYFGPARELLGEPSERVVLTDPSTIADLVEFLRRERPALAPLLDSSRFAVDDRYVGSDFVLRDGVEADLIPPVAGG